MNLNLDFSTWDQSDWVIAGVVGFALFMGFSAMASAGKRLRKRKVWK